MAENMGISRKGCAQRAAKSRLRSLSGVISAIGTQKSGPPVKNEKTSDALHAEGVRMLLHCGVIDIWNGSRNTIWKIPGEVFGW